MPEKDEDPFNPFLWTSRAWSCVVERDQYNPEIARDLDRTARLAWSGDWAGLLTWLEGPDSTSDPDLVNTPRVGSRSGYAPLHHAAWHGAGRAVVEHLLALHAWRTLRTTSGELPVDIARARGHDHLVDLLAVPDEPPWIAGAHQATERLMQAVIESRLLRDCIDGPFRVPQLGPLRKIEPDAFMLCGVPGMYGGFFLRSFGNVILVEGSSRMQDYGGERHRITKNEARLVASGWDGPTIVTDGPRPAT